MYSQAPVVVGYAFSPIDLIPDPIPILGHLDDLILIPLGVALAICMIPAPVLTECRERARAAAAEDRPVNRVAAVVVVAVWLILAALAIHLVAQITSEISHLWRANEIVLLGSGAQARKRRKSWERKGAGGAAERALLEAV